MFGEIADDFGVPAESVVGLLNSPNDTRDKSLTDARIEWKYSCSSMWFTFLPQNERF